MNYTMKQVKLLFMMKMYFILHKPKYMLYTLVFLFISLSLNGQVQPISNVKAMLQEGNKDTKQTLFKEKTSSMEINSHHFQGNAPVPEEKHFSPVDQLENAHFRIFKTIQNKPYAKAVLAFLQETRTEVALHFPNRHTAKSGTDQINDWALSYPAEFKSYLDALNRIMVQLRRNPNLEGFSSELLVFHEKYNSYLKYSSYDALLFGDVAEENLTALIKEKEFSNLRDGFRSCNIQASICEPGVAGPFNFVNSVPNVDFYEGCLNQEQGLNEYGYILLNITGSGNLNMLVNGNANTGFIDVILFNIPPGQDPCEAITIPSNEIDCGYAQNDGGCIQFGNQFGCNSSFTSPYVNAGDQIMIIVQNWGEFNATPPGSTSFTLELGTGASTGPYDGTITPVAPVCSNDGPFQLFAATGGGTWSASCGSCIDSETGFFNPNAAGVGSHSINYSVGAAPCTGTGNISLQVNQCCPPVSFTNLPATLTCTDAPVTVFANESGLAIGEAITPCYVVELTTNNDHTTLEVVYLENGTPIGSLFPTPNTVWSGYGSFMSPSANNQVQLCETAASIPGGNINYTIRDCHSGALLASGTWVMDGACQTVNVTPPGALSGSATWSSTSSGLTVVTDWGAAVFDPAIAGPGTWDVTYCWDPQNGCASDCNTQSITVLSPFNATFNYSNIIYCSTDANQTPNITGDSGGIFSASPAGLSINSTTGVVNIGASSPGLYSISYTVGTAPCVAETSVDFEIIQAPNAGSNGSHTMCSTDGTVNLFGYLNGTPMTTGTWSGPSVLTDGHLGTFNPLTMTPGVYTYTVSGVAPCSDAVAQVTISVNPEPNAGSNGSHTICSTDGTVNLFSYLGGTPMTTGTWSGPSFLGNGHLGTFDPSSMIAGVYTYTVAGVAPCANDEAEVTIIVNLTPATPLAGTDATYCQGDAISNLTATASSGGSLAWYDNVALTNEVGTGTTFTPSSVVGTHTYYVTETMANCESDATEVTIIVNPTPAAPLAGADATYCEGDAIADLTATAGSGGTINWYSDVALTNVVETGTTFTPSSAVGTHTYYVTETVANCESSASVVTIIVNPTPVAPVAGTNATYCQGDVIADLTATAGSAGFLTWYDDMALATVVGTGVTFTPSSAVGTHTYYVTETLGSCESDATEVTIIVNPTPSFTIGTTQDPTTCGGMDGFITLTGLNASSSYLVTYTDNSGLVNLGTITTNASGEYLITGLGADTYSNITVSLGSCSSVEGPVTLSDPNAPTFTLSSTNPTTCGGTDGTITIEGLDATTTYDISYNNGIGVVNLAGITTDATGNYVITGLSQGTYTNITVTLAGCLGTNAGPVVLTDPSAPAAPLAGTNATYCEGDVIADLTATAGSGGGLIWYDDVALTNIVETGTTFTPSSAVGTHTYYVTETVANCESSTSLVTIVVSPTPVAPVAGPDGLYCEGETVLDISATSGSDGTINWYSDAALTSQVGTGNTLSPDNTVGVHTYYATELLGNCESDATEVIIVVNPTPTFSIEQETNPTECGSSDGSFTIIGLDPTSSYQVTYNSGATTIDLGNITPNASGSITVGNLAAGTYTNITVTLGLCSFQGGPVILVSPGTPDAPQVSGAATYCEGQAIAPLTASALSGGTLTWYADAELNNAINTGTTLNPDSTPGTYIYYVTETVDGCESGATLVTVQINPTPEDPTVSGQGEFCNDAEVTLTEQSGSGTISWYTDAELTNLIQTGSSLSVSQNPGSYTYYVVASIGNCISNSVQATALIIDCDTLQLEIPTAFTPNFDGVNDTWEIPGLKEKYPNNRVLIYNRWGNLIFESEGYDTPWDGTFNGEALPVGSYFFIIDFNDGITEQERGTVTIVKKN
jgi:gliding motility-associated-like protein